MLLDLLPEKDFLSVAVIGTGKNTGKTFTVNQLILEAQAKGLNTAITTIGLDGEKYDSLFQHQKPPITLSPGQIVANAKSLLTASQLDYEILSTTDISTSLGEVVLARARSRGRTILAGPNTSSELALITEKIRRLPVDLFVIDGAVDRRSQAFPSKIDTVIVAVGAETAWERSTLLTEFTHFFGLLNVPGLTELETRNKLQNLSTAAKGVFLSSGNVIGEITSTHKEELTVAAKAVTGKADALYLKGMLTDTMLTTLLPVISQTKPFTLITQSPSSLFLSPASLKRLKAWQVELRVLVPIHISAVTVNPFSSSFGYANPSQILKDIGKVVDPIPCLDVALGRSFSCKRGG